MPFVSVVVAPKSVGAPGATTFVVQLALSVTPPAVERRSRKYTSFVPSAHFVPDSEIAVVGFELFPHLAVLGSSPLDTFHPANVQPLFVGADTRNGVPRTAFVGAYLPAVPPARS